MGLLDGFKSLQQDVNKVGQFDQPDSVVSTLLPELTLEMEDEELLKLAKDWTKVWGEYEPLILKKQTENENYWLGEQFGKDKGAVDNLIFESLETFLPIATRPKADPVVESDNTPEGNAIADKVRKMLIYVSDILSYNLKMKQVARFWALYMLGVMKVGWSMKENDITCVPIRPQKLILDPKATIEEGEYTGYYIGEKMEDMASDLVARFPEKEAFIKDKVKDKMGTKLSYIMWTTDEYVFWTCESEVLAKNKNPHWNYETEEPAPMNEFGSVPVDPATGQPQMVKVPGRNHFNAPKKPYVFLSIFNLGKAPHDDTNLIQQNLPLQDLVNKRLLQIDKNADNTNGGLIVSGDSFTEEQAKKAGDALRKGGSIWVPTGDVNAAVKRDSGTALPQFVYESLIDYRNEIRNIFGTRGSSPQGTIKEDTVGGKNIIKQQDTDRIGGGVANYLEQFSDKAYNWFVQLMYVYYDEPHMASVMGAERTKEYIALSNADLTRKLLIGVKEGSMIPHDPVSQRGEAMQLWSEKGIDPITFFDRLEFPNPRESAKNLFLWLSDPIQLFPDLLAQQQQAQAQMMAQTGAQVQQQQAQAGEQEEAKAGKNHEREMQKIMLQGVVKQPTQ